METQHFFVSTVITKNNNKKKISKRLLECKLKGKFSGCRVFSGATRGARREARVANNN